MIRVGIADDEDLVRDGMAALLGNQQGMIVVATVSTAYEAVELADSGAIDVLLLDIALGGRGGLDALSEIVSHASASAGHRSGSVGEVGVIMVSSFSAEEYAVRAIRAGAGAYVPKASDPKVLIDAIRAVSSGRRYVSPEIVELLANYATEGPAKRHHRLSNREYQVFLLLASGRSVTEIADDLSLSISSVSTYRSRILEKLELPNTAAVIRYAAKHDLA